MRVIKVKPIVALKGRCSHHSGNLKAVKWHLSVCVAYCKVIRMQVYIAICLKTFDILIISVSPEAVTHLRRRKLTGSVDLLPGVLMMRPVYESTGLQHLNTRPLSTRAIGFKTDIFFLT